MRVKNKILEALGKDFKIIEERELIKGKDMRFSDEKEKFRIKYFVFPEDIEMFLLERDGGNAKHYNFKFPKDDEKFTFRIVDTGKIKVSYDGNEKIIGEKQAYVMKNNIFIEDCNIEYYPETTVLLALSITKKFLKRFMVDVEVERFLNYFEESLFNFEDGFIEKVSGEAIDCLKKILTYKEKVDVSRELYMYGKIIELMSLLIKKVTTDKANVKNCVEERVEAIKKYIEENYDCNDVLEKLPTNFYTNKVTLLEQFKNVTGETFHMFVKRLKLEKAYEMLINTNINISEVADKVGYKNNGYFSKIFFEQFNLKPNEVRKKIKNN
ncbi:MAG: helix-turn-helix transcriptional regulator [Sebaldella sp.]|nr:helix-turn-helix transcriptional regulator [Sebaldella sp.]